VFSADVEAAQLLFDVKKDGNASTFRVRLRKKDGTALWVEVQGTPMHNTEGVFMGIVGTFSVPTMSNHLGHQRLSWAYGCIVVEMSPSYS
jgi:PAS domain-containing protein